MKDVGKVAIPTAAGNWKSMFIYIFFLLFSEVAEKIKSLRMRNESQFVLHQAMKRKKLVTDFRQPQCFSYFTETK